jgi:hypothetical protein
MKFDGTPVKAGLRLDDRYRGEETKPAKAGRAVLLRGRLRIYVIVHVLSFFSQEGLPGLA